MEPGLPGGDSPRGRQPTGTGTAAEEKAAASLPLPPPTPAAGPLAAEAPGMEARITKWGGAVWEKQQTRPQSQSARQYSLVSDTCVCSFDQNASNFKATPGKAGDVRGPSHLCSDLPDRLPGTAAIVKSEPPNQVQEASLTHPSAPPLLPGAGTPGFQRLLP